MESSCKGAPVVGIVIDGDRLVPGQETMGVTNTSEILGVTAGHVRAMLKGGIPRGYREGSLWLGMWKARVIVQTIPGWAEGPGTPS